MYSISYISTGKTYRNGSRPNHLNARIDVKSPFWYALPVKARRLTSPLSCVYRDDNGISAATLQRQGESCQKTRTFRSRTGVSENEGNQCDQPVYGMQYLTFRQDQLSFQWLVVHDDLMQVPISLECLVRQLVFASTVGGPLGSLTFDASVVVLNVVSCKSKALMRPLFFSSFSIKESKSRK